MKWYMNMKIASKLITGFVIVALIAATVGVIGIVKLKDIDGDYSLMYSQNTVPIAILGDISPEFQRIRVNLRNMIMDKDINNRKSYLDKINQYQSDIDSLLAEYGKEVSTGEEKTTYDALLSQLDKLKPLQSRVIELINGGQEDAALNELLNTSDPVARDVDTSLGTLIDINKKQASERSEQNSANANSAVIMMLGVAVIGVILSVLLGLFISRIINKPIKKLVSAADKLSMGDVNVNVEATTKDEIGDLMKSFASMVENIREQAMAVSKVADGDLTIDVKVRSENDLLGKKLSDMIATNNEILGSINSASDQVAAGARQVSASSQALSQGSTEQASSVEEITSSITELAAQTKQNAINASQANELAIVAKDNAVLGNSQMQDMVKAMAEINDSSNNISKIIKVIDEIAFQTNILALNAAVEAARAGQHGKGFAVVAEEVRNLAARSANAAKETTSMIEGSIKKVEAGTKIANDTAEALYKIVSDVTKAVELVGEIAVASNQQATGISQISSAVEQVSQVVQTNSATAEESASASEELSSQAELLRESVRKFQLKKVRLDSNGKNGINPEMIQAIEEMLEKKKDVRNDSHNSGAQEAAAARIKIDLDDKEFGKY